MTVDGETPDGNETSAGASVESGTDVSPSSAATLPSSSSLLSTSLTFPAEMLPPIVATPNKKRHIAAAEKLRRLQQDVTASVGDPKPALHDLYAAFVVRAIWPAARTALYSAIELGRSYVCIRVRATMAQILLRQFEQEFETTTDSGETTISWSLCGREAAPATTTTTTEAPTTAATTSAGSNASPIETVVDQAEEDLDNVWARVIVRWGYLPESVDGLAASAGCGSG